MFKRELARCKSCGHNRLFLARECDKIEIRISSEPYPTYEDGPFTLLAFCEKCGTSHSIAEIEMCGRFGEEGDLAKCPSCGGPLEKRIERDEKSNGAALGEAVWTCQSCGEWFDEEELSTHTENKT
jgi:hypothetical protein